MSNILSVALLLQASRACNDHQDDQLAAARDDTAEYLANAYGYGPGQMWDPYYQPSSRILDFANQYEGRSPIKQKLLPNNIPFKNYFAEKNIDDGNQPEGRFGLSGLGAQILNAGFFNNRFPTGVGNRPLINFANRLPISINPNFANPIAAFDSCTAPSGESGICAPGAVCSLFGGRPSGSCLLGGVCCINAVTTCGGTISLNNTYWQSPSTSVSRISTCSLTVKLDTKLVEQKKPICQVRLDFVSFTLDQPLRADGVRGDCVDTFRVGGTINQVPAICGVNSGQHMYLHVPPSDTDPTDLQMMMSFGAATLTRNWNIKIAMIPCGASYTAPSDCLQYFTSATGRVSSFNWQNLPAVQTRQFNSQQYNICFRNELIDSQRTTQICLQICTPIVDGADAFSLSGTAVDDTTSGSGAANCRADFLLFQNGGHTAGGVTTSADRFCGSALNPTVALGGGSSVPVCSTIRPFRITFVTNAAEDLAVNESNNQGFCLTFQQSVQ